MIKPVLIDVLRANRDEPKDRYPKHNVCQACNKSIMLWQPLGFHEARQRWECLECYEATAPVEPSDSQD